MVVMGELPKWATRHGRSGDGDGHGDGHGSGCGDGYGYGCGHGYGHGYGHGCGYGCGYAISRHPDGTVSIGCQRHAPAVWLGETGARLAQEHSYPEHVQACLRALLESWSRPMTMRERAEAALSAWVSAHGPGEYLSFAIAFAEAEVRAEREALDARLSAAAAWTERDRLCAERDEAVGLIGALANHLESAVAIMTDCYVLYEDEAADERELVAEARAFLDRTAPAKEPSE